MKITALETVRLAEFGNLCWVRLHTDEGLVGLGETFFGASAVEAYLHDSVAPRLLGTDPLQIEARNLSLSDYLGWRDAGVETRGNSAIDLAFVDAPVDHVLTASARTSNGRAEVAVHETFEGAFDLSTTNAGTPTVHARDGRDPAGHGRKRGHAVRVGPSRRKEVHGNVWWGEENKERGSVSVGTSNGRVQLTV